MTKHPTIQAKALEVEFYNLVKEVGVTQTEEEEVMSNIAVDTLLTHLTAVLNYGASVFDECMMTWEYSESCGYQSDAKITFRRQQTERIANVFRTLCESVYKITDKQVDFDGYAKQTLEVMYS